MRAYQPAESSGYQGSYFVTGELRTDLANWEQITLPSFMPSAQTYLFVDHMLAQSQYNVRSRADYWSGYGVGLQEFSIFNLLTFDIYWSEPLDGEVHAEEKDFMMMKCSNSRYQRDSPLKLKLCEIWGKTCDAGSNYDSKH